MQESYDPFFAEFFHPYDLSCGEIKFRYIRNFGLIKTSALMEILELQITRPRYENLINRIKLDNCLHLLSIEKFIELAKTYFITNEEIAEMLQLLSPKDTIFDKDGMPYATLCEYTKEENLILIDKGRSMSPIIQDFFHLMMELSDEEFLELNYGNPEYHKFVEIESQYTEELKKKTKYYQELENKNGKQSKSEVIDMGTSEIRSDKHQINIKISNSNQDDLRKSVKSEDFNKLIFNQYRDFNKLNFTKISKIVNYNIFQLLELISKNHNKIIIFNKLSELIRKKINIFNIKQLDEYIIKLIQMNIDKKIRIKFPTINQMWYDICYYYKTGIIREKYQQEIENIGELEKKAAWLIAIISKLDYYYCIGDKNMLRTIIKDHALDLENNLTIMELSKYYQLCNWIPINK